MKVLDLAKQLRKHPKELIRFLGEMGVKVKSPTTRLDDATVEEIRSLFSKKPTTPKAPERDADNPTLISLPDSSVTLKQFAEKAGVPITEIMTAVLKMGYSLNLNSEVDIKTITEIAEALHVIVDVEKKSEISKTKLREEINKIEEYEIDHAPEDLEERPPIVTIMGHVDHGKTLLLDVIRKSNVVEGEAGGITQHIGAYQVTKNDKKITFLDTPGHAAFTTLRARGAQLTDIVILVVAADDGIMPQTVEAIHHAKSAKVPIIVAINKIDKPGADVEKVKQQLTEHELVPEDWGGTTIIVPLSAKTLEGIPTLLEMIQIVADMQELKSIKKGLAKGIVIESHLSRKKGPVATVLIKSGTLKIGDFFTIGPSYGKVRAMHNDLGKRIDSAEPGAPVEILGIQEVPRPGDILNTFKTEKEAKSAASNAPESIPNLAGKQTSLSNLSKEIEEGETNSINIIVKADVHGSLEALVSSLVEQSTETIAVNVVHSATGPVNENDVMLAKAANGFIISFNVDTSPEADRLRDQENIEVKRYSIIYEAIEDLQKALKGLYKPVYIEVESGKAEVRQIFKFSKLGSIAGSYVLEGKILRSQIIKVFRGKDELFKGKLHSLKRFKDDVKEVAQNFECGIVIDGFDDLKEGDVIVSYAIEEKKQ